MCLARRHTEPAVNKYMTTRTGMTRATARAAWHGMTFVELMAWWVRGAACLKEGIGLHRIARLAVPISRSLASAHEIVLYSKNDNTHPMTCMGSAMWRFLACFCPCKSGEKWIVE
jgi:hypothetical protein